MKKLLLPIVLAIAAVAGGGFAGQLLKAPATEDAGDATASKSTERESGAAEASSEGDANEIAAPAAASPSDELVDLDRPAHDFIKLDRQFVVPVLEGDRVASLVVLSIAIEVDEGSGDVVFAQEPKIRDAFLRVLFTHAQSRGFDGEFTRENRLADLRGSLQEAASDILGKISHGVLLTNIVRQDV